MGRDRGWKLQSAAVAVRHDHAADESRAGAPRGGERMMLRAVATGVRDAVGPRELVAEVVRRGRLQRLSVAHHRLGGERLPGAGEPLTGALAPGQHRHRQHRLLHVDVHPMQDRQALCYRLGGRLVGRVTLLPEELGRAQEEPGPQLPPHHVRPLVVEQGQIAVGLDPARICAPDGCLGRGPNHERLVEHRSARLGHNRDLRREPVDEVALSGEHRLWNQQREVDVLVAGGLDPVVELRAGGAPRSHSRTA